MWAFGKQSRILGVFRQQAPGGGTLPKNWWPGYVDSDPFFLTHSPIVPPPFFFWLALTEWPPFVVIRNQYFTISHRMTPFLQHFVKIFNFLMKFLSKMCQNLIFCVANLSYSHRLTPFFWSSYWVTPFSEKNLSPKDLSFELLSEHPHHFQIWVPPPHPRTGEQKKVF